MSSSSIKSRIDLGWFRQHLLKDDSPHWFGAAISLSLRRASQLPHVLLINFETRLA